MTQQEYDEQTVAVSQAILDSVCRKISRSFHRITKPQLHSHFVVSCDGCGGRLSFPHDDVFTATTGVNPFTEYYCTSCVMDIVA